MATTTDCPYVPGDEVTVKMWKDGLPSWRRTTILAVDPDLSPSGYQWYLTVRNPFGNVGIPGTIIVGCWDDGNGNGVHRA